jgi:protease-4
MWQSIFDYGSLRATNSTEIGLVDYIPPVDPLISLLNVNRREAKKKQKKSFVSSLLSEDEEDEETTISDRVKFDEKFGMHESFSKFSATEAVSLAKYKQMLNKKERVERIRMKINYVLHRLSETSTATSYILTALRTQPEKSTSVKCDKVAVVTVDGTIGSSLSYEIIRCLRKIREDKGIKAVVLRVNSPGGSVVSSEAILEELKLLDKV